ncbi:MAG: IclR family transcriptional regulator [Propionibacteriaceae bacterium]|nr:IclR family transcriptional regulator [Propionibacteriaceae bacterium]
MGQAVTDRALAILGAFDTDHARLGLTQLARRAGIPLSTCHRLVGKLIEWGALEKAGRTYHIGRRIWELGLLAPTQQSAIELATPFMQDVLFVTRNVVNLFVLDEDRALLLGRIAGTAVGTPFRKVGDRMELHASAAGKILLAHAGPSLVEQCCQQLTPLTDKTITDPAVLRNQLAEARRRGYAVTEGESALENNAIAVPVLGADGVVVASLGIVQIRGFANPGRVVPVLQLAARGIARQWRFAEVIAAERP